MTTTILLARHGQTESNVTGFYMGWSDEDLNEAGYAQAHSLSARLASQPIAAAYASPLRRTCTTAAVIAKPHNLKLNVLDELLEIRLGDWEGLYTHEIRQRWPELWQQSRVDPVNITMPNGESFQQVTERAIRGLATVLEANQSKQALIVTHDIVVRVLVAHILGVSNSIYRRFEINNASLSVIRVIDGHLRLITLNDTSHLEA
ncbi:histidine phosphatase family protein [Chloroflexota bacterium]